MRTHTKYSKNHLTQNESNNINNSSLLVNKSRDILHGGGGQDTSSSFDAVRRSLVALSVFGVVFVYFLSQQWFLT